MQNSAASDSGAAAVGEVEIEGIGTAGPVEEVQGDSYLRIEIDLAERKAQDVAVAVVASAQVHLVGAAPVVAAVVAVAVVAAAEAGQSLEGAHKDKEMCM